MSSLTLDASTSWCIANQPVTILVTYTNDSGSNVTVTPPQVWARPGDSALLGVTKPGNVTIADSASYTWSVQAAFAVGGAPPDSETAPFVLGASCVAGTTTVSQAATITINVAPPGLPATRPQAGGQLAFGEKANSGLAALM